MTPVGSGARMFSLLYIDDEPGLLELGQLFLERTGEFTVTTALSAEAGLVCLAQRDFDAVISDYQMPGMDGISLLKNVRKSFGNIPFVLFTGRGREEVVIEAINNGVDFYLQKGGDPKAQFAELAHKVRQAVNRHQAETALSDSEKRLADIINFLPDATFAIDTQGIVIAWNRAMERMTGVSSAEILGKGNFVYAIPFYQERRPLLINLVLDDDPALTAKYPFVRKEGRTLISEITIPHFNDGRGAALWFTASPLYNRNGDVVGAIESIREVTERKQAEEDLVSANREYTNLLDQIQDVYYRSDTEGRLIKASRSWATLFGYDDISECLGRSIADDFYVNPSDRKQLLDEIYRNGKVSGYEVLLKKKDGTPVLVEASSHLYYDPAGNIIGIEGTFRDITDRKQAELELRAAYDQLTASEEELRGQLDEIIKAQEDRERTEKNFRILVDNAPDAIYIQTNTRFRYLNNAALRLLGASSADELLGKSMWDRIHPSFHERIRGRVKNLTVDLQPVDLLEEVYVKLDGTPVDVEVKAVPFQYEGEHGVLVMLRDISARKRAEAELRTAYEQLTASEEELRGQYEELAVTQEDLQRHKLQLEEIAGTLPGVIYQFYARPDGSMGLYYVSSRAAEVFGISSNPEEFFERFTQHVDPRDREAFLRSNVDVARDGLPWHYEGRFIKPSGDEIWFEGISRPIRRDHELVFNGVLLDITARKQAEEALRTRSEEYQKILQTAMDGFCIIAMDGSFIDVNDAFCTSLGYTREEVLTLSLPNIEVREIPKETACHMQDIISKGWDRFETRFQQKDGGIIDVEVSVVYTEIHGGRFITFSRDITGRKRETEELMLLKISADRSSDEVFWLDFTGQILYVNDAACRATGYSREEFAAMKIFELDPDFQPEVWEASVADLRERKTQFITTRHQRKDGSIMDVEIVAVYVIQDEREYSFAYVRDITERKRTENQVRESEQNYRLLFETATEGILIAQGDRMVNVNSALISLLRRPFEVITSRPFTDFIHPDDRELVMSRHLQRMRGGVPPTGYEFRIITGDGQERWVRINSTRILWSDKPASLSFLTDITEQKMADDRLIAANEEYTNLLGQIQDIYYRSDTEGRLVRASRSLATLLGYDDISECIGRNIADDFYLHSADRSHFVEELDRKGSVTDYEVFLKKRDGTPVLISTNSHVYTDTTGKVIGVEGTFRDITSRKKIENALRESEEKYRMLVESSFDGIAIHQDGILVYVNRTAARLLGSDDPGVFVGRPAIDLVAPAFRELILERIREAPESSQQLLHEQFQRLDGTVIDVDVTSTPGTWKGRPAAFVTFRDITEQKRSEVALRESESRWKQWIEQSPIPIALYRLDGTGLYSNEHYVRITGYTLDDIPDMDTYWRTMFPDPQYRQEIKLAWEDRVKTSILRGAYIEPLETRIACRDGVTRTLEFTGLVIGDTILVTYYDLTTRKKAEDALHESEEKYRTLVEVNRDIIYSLDTDGTILYTSPQITAQLGYMPDEVMGYNFSEIIHPDDIGSLVRHVQENFMSGKPVAQDQFRLRRKDGTYRWYEDKSIYATDRRGRHIVSGTIRDINEEKTAQDALRESEEKFRTILDTTSEWIWDLDLHGCHTYSNPAVESLLGYTKDEILGINTFEMIHPDDRDRIKQIFASSVNKKSGWRNVRLRWQHKDGTYRFLESNATAIFNERGELTGFRGADRDITESVHAEDALRESEEKFRALVETTSDFIWEVDAAGVYTYVSPQVYQILGYEPDEMVGRTPFDFMLPEEIEKVTAEFNHCIASRLPIVALENKAIRKDGSVVVLETSGVVRTANDGRYLGYRGIDRDITTRKEAAERTTRLSALKQDLLRTAPLEEKLKQITDGIVDIFGADFARIWMSGPGDLCDAGCIHAEVTKGPHVCRNRTSCLHLIASSGRYTQTDGNHRRVPFGAYKIGRLATGEEAHFITNDVTHDPRVHDHAWAESLGLVSFSGFQLVSPDGEPIGVLAFFSREPITQDIVDDLDDLATTTSQVIQTGMAEEAQREREEWARTILNTAQTGIVLIDAETHQILDANPKALGMIGLPRDSVIGKICHYFICPAEKGNCPVTDGGQVVDTSERILVTASDTMIPVLKTVLSVSLGGKNVLVESFVDISEQKLSEAAIREANRKLNLLSSITRHDVANQITVILGYTQLAALSNPEPVVADFLAKIESGIDTIQRQIEFTRTYQDLGIQAPSWFVIGDVIRSLGHEGIKLVCTCKSYEIYADPMIGRVFFNLFDNAARYGARVTTVRVGCAKKGKKLVIRFADNGVGIPSIEKKKIFQKGYGKHTGFGLFLAREILAITGITIQETGTYGKGAVFEITVPESSFR